MTTRRSRIFFLPVCLFIAFTTAAQSPTAENLPKYREVDAKLGTGGQPTDAGLRELAKNGYKAIINLRTANEGVDLAAEEKLAKELGLRYVSIPVVTAVPKEEQADEFLKILAELKDEKTFVHCAAANRVGGFVMIQQVMQGGSSLEKAEEEAKQIGLRSENLRQFAKDYIAKKKK